MKFFKYVLKQYFYALATLLLVFGGIIWFRPERALELISILTPLSLLMRLYMLLILNLIWAIWFIIFDLWNSYRVLGIEDKDV